MDTYSERLCYSSLTIVGSLAFIQFFAQLSFVGKREDDTSDMPELESVSDYDPSVRHFVMACDALLTVGSRPMLSSFRVAAQS